MSEPAVTQNVGRYRIDGVLGEGAMAVVYAGFDPDIEREVAIKCLHREVAADPAYRQRFLVEARAAGQLTHPHIVTVFDAGETGDGRAYIAMERLSGETLASRVAREGFPPLPAIIELIMQVAAALDYAHAHGVVHHDIKPENIMLADGWQQAKVNDFGIADLRRSLGDGDALRAEVAGTPAYMAPEHLRGERTDARSDLFSLGVVLYWLLAGKLPWRDIADVRELMLERQRLPRPALQPRDPSTPAILLDIVHALLAPAPAERYQQGAEVVEDLRLARRECERRAETPLATRLLSLRMRWVGVLGVLLSVTLLLGLAAIHAKQNAAITGLARDFGSSLGRMVASESAEDLLLGDRAATRALVQDIARNQQIHYLAVADRGGEIIASTRPDQVGQKLPALSGQQALSPSGDIQGYRSSMINGSGLDEMLLFDVPVHYQSAVVGELRLGISDAPLRAAQKTTLWVIIAVLLATLAVVVGAAWWMSRRLLSLLDMLGNALLKVAHGDFRYRIRLVRRDELGRLFATFNVMNRALQATPNRLKDSPPPAQTEDIARPTQILSAADRPAGSRSPRG
ncbi:protein kinase [Rhodanobacter sp. AS-Z3]|uniref:protein kinase domain-containing protein n=1 Tax=Rhodanobacter sp. AS-Z3 TaxID=3031330 RepID=UPI00247857A0|nr:protein kinase [Rhodanobacter sp. AS-Z3]WEN14713.1 protein kinase [Rhodanobacter sp. AS-Z3]